MSSLRRIICLANSRKHGAYCVAGIDMETREWIRPVSDLDDGRVERRTMQLGDDIPHPGDLIELPLADSGPDYGFECENRSILPGAWRRIEALKPIELMAYCSTDRPILHTNENYVTVQHMQSLPFGRRRTLQLVEAFELETYSDGPSAQGGSRWNASFVSAAGDRLNARITDLALIDKLEQGYVPAAHCLVTVSLSMPYRKDDWEGEGDPCWKLVAAIVELEPGRWRTVAQPPTAAQLVSGGRRTGLDDSVVTDALRRVFGFDAFRPNQADIVRAILDKRDCFVVMPTGGGKSLCYQLPAHLLPGTCMVISPLISLMKDQVDAARDNGLSAAYLNSTLSDMERMDVFRELTEGELDLIYVSPERFAMEAFVNNLKNVPLSLVAVDEAHCISEWGHDFRPDYLCLSEIVRHFPGVPVAAFTATATHRVQQNIIERLGLRAPFVVRASFDRPNLFYEVVPKYDVDMQILDLVRQREGQPGIIYRTTRRDVDGLAELLREEGVQALGYHAGMDDGQRAANQTAFSRDEVNVVVATIAFGMGVDKPNVRYVIHGDLPKNMESYYQETGRAGRDGEPARCTLFFSRGDIPRIRHFIEQVEDDTERRRLEASLGEMVSYAVGTSVCRRRRILGYFGEQLEQRNCGGCDVCAGGMEQVDITIDAQKVLSAVVRTGQRFGAGHVVDIVRGASTKRIRQFGHDRLPTHGVGKDHDKRYWRQVVDELVAEHLVVQSEGKYPVLAVTEAGWEVLRGERPVTTLRHEQPAVLPPPRDTRVTAEPQAVDAQLFECLRALRRTLADERGVPPYVVFSDRSLRDMAARMPETEEQMRAVHGVGEAKLYAYGDMFLREIAAYRARNPDICAPSALPAQAGRSRKRAKNTARSATFEATWELLQQGLSLTEIAQRRSLSQRTIVNHVERFLLEGKEVDIDRYVSRECRDEIVRRWPDLKSDLLTEITGACAIPVSFEDAVLVRAWIRAGRGPDGEAGRAAG
ncbi:MAG: DNA helicase RecQ [Chitinivibrionales bacterium]|nr:DNA helicase RecQ [Chitinivibrionales bacterium]